MNYRKNRPLALVHIALVAIILVASSAWGQTPAASYPDRPVKIVVPFAPGAGTDAMGRLMAQKLGEALGATFVVENRAGAAPRHSVWNLPLTIHSSRARWGLWATWYSELSTNPRGGV